MLTAEQRKYLRTMAERLTELERIVADQQQQIEQLKKKPTSSRFSPPTIEEVTAQIRHKGYLIDPETFWHYYNARGWRLSSNQVMKCWKSALVTFSKHTQFTPPETLKQQAVDRQALARKRDREQRQRQMAAERKQHEQDFGLKLKKP